MSTRLSWREKLSYGIGNFGINLSFGMTGAYLMYFYTDIYGVDPGTVASLFLIARAIDGLFDPFMGLLIDRTDTRWGKHRPYLLGLALPFALCGVAVFWTPPLGDVGKIVYIFASYTLLGMLYSGVSLPLNSMLPTLTRDARERTATNAIRETLGSGATVGIGYAALPLVHALGDDSEAHGFLLVAALLALVTIAALVLTFANTREREAPTESPQVLTTRQSVQATKGNWPWIATMLVNFCFWIGFTAHLQSFIYYARDVLRQPELVSSLMLTMLAVLVGTALSAPIANRIGKRTTGIIGGGLAMAATAAIALSDAPAWLVATNIAAYLGQGLIGGLLFALMADAVDFGEWKSGFRAQGFLFAASSFGVKLGMSIGGAAGAWMLSRAGYVAGVEATPAVQAAITAGHVWFPAISFAAMAASLKLFTFPTAYAQGARTSGA